MNNGKRKVSDETFVKVWTLAGNLDEVTTKTGLGRNSVQAKASLLRRKGVRLKFMHQRQPTDVQALNALIASVE